ncbi:hypothetical protein, conserved [Trypanosoma brucei gambiense DAL972]|uniref:Cyclin N-terminal domain-containing protein n=1 Tax=Trypanosoma brucei gambiense (strain MHOM/CI/86/DAL972) TaxID=679716 RepID=D0A3T4_TRYB9|nr:hypothetical protein, conserved [Trypanosoma brucei gambiense DAL972]CBH15928.1 hypothetical protein, conserved [Trypanosoma brucei gambiense DAL972]|eukprot:XP_011778192.1 hypothetical protein, conserved [Trypanosoma brucei gambiense DAL972]
MRLLSFFSLYPLGSFSSGKSNMDTPPISDDDKEVIDRLFASDVPQSLSRHAVLILHYHRTVFGSMVPSNVLLAGCLLYSCKWLSYPSGNSFLKNYFQGMKTSDIVGLEMVLHGTVRQNFMLVEACLRSEMSEIVRLNDVPHNRERIVLVCLNLVRALYRTRWCLLPETAARGALLVACEMCDVHLKSLPESFNTTMVTRAVDYLRSVFAQSRC